MWRPNPEDERAGGLGQDRLRKLRPAVMERYDWRRTERIGPVDAMRQVVLYFHQPRTRTGAAPPNRAAILERDTARRAADAEITLYRSPNRRTLEVKRRSCPPGRETVTLG